LQIEPKKGEVVASPFLFVREFDSVKMDLGITQ
jgi:hypothetical protein